MKNATLGASGCTPLALFRRVAFAAVLLLGLGAQSALAQATLTGTVSNTATGRTLEGATVSIKGSTRQAVTDNLGAYRLTDVPTGNVVLVVSYTGLDTQEVSVQVSASGPNNRDVGLTSEIYRLGQFVVSGEREGNAQAITLQRQSTGVKSIVSADAFGSLAGNPADLLMRMPGVEGESVGGDTRYVRIRGMSHQLNTITMDGNRMADGGSAGATREYQFQQIGADSIERIEVTKSPTPDMDADSIGGAVNMVSKSAFDRKGGRRLGGSYGAIWRPFDERDEPIRNYSVSYSEVFADKLGVSFNYGHRATRSLIDVSSQTHQALPAGVEGPAYTYSFMIGDTRNKRTRWGGGLKLDYKWSENTRFFLNTTMNKHDEHANIVNTTWATAQTVATLDAAGNPTGTGTILPGYTDNVTQWRGLNNSTVSRESASTHKIGKSWHYQIGGVHRYEGVNLDYDAYFSTSDAIYPGNRTFTYIARGIGMRLERKDEPYRPFVTQTAGPDITQISAYTDNTYNIAAMTGVDEYWGSSINFKKEINTVVPAYIKTGLRLREQTRDNTNTPWTGRYVGTGGVMNLAQFVHPKTENVIHGGRYPLLPTPTFAARESQGSAYGYTGFNIDTLLRNNPEQFVRNSAANLQTELVGDTQFKETVTAGYMMGSFDVGKVSVTGGFRVEKTETEGTGALSGITAEERARRAAWVGTVTETEQLRRTRAEFGMRQTRTGKYQQVFPGMHFKYQPYERFVARLGYATNIGRPSIGQLIPRTTVNFDTSTISTSNPSLKPQFADNFDFGVEYYFEPAGVVSAGVFLKEIRSFIFTQGGATVGAGADNGFEGLYEGYLLTTQYNGGFAKVKGFELNYNQQFTFLPGWLGGFSVFANYTRMEVEGNYGAGTAISLAPTSEVAGFNPETGNLGISYIRGKGSLRFQFNHVGRYLNSYNANQSRLLYRKARSTLDIKSTYELTKNFGLYLDVSNVLAEGDRVLEYYGGRPQVLHKMGPQFFFGVNARL